MESFFLNMLLDYPVALRLRSGTAHGPPGNENYA